MLKFKHFTLAVLTLFIGACESRKAEILFPQLSEQKMVMLALLKGKLVLENGCLKVEAENTPKSYTIVWPPYVELYTEAGKVEVRENGHTVATLGEQIQMGGGIADAPYLDMKIKNQCGKPFWIAGKIYLNSNE